METASSAALRPTPRPTLNLCASGLVELFQQSLALTVAEADRKLRDLAEHGHIEVRARGGAVFYALWGNGLETARRIEGST